MATNKRVRTRCAGLLVAALVGVLPTMTMAGAQALSVPAADPRVSKVPDVIRYKIDRVTAALAAGANPAALSDPYVVVDESGRIDVELHSVTPVGAAESAAVEALGGEVTLSTADIAWPGGTPLPGFHVIRAHVPYTQISAVAALSWVVAVRPTEHTAPDVGAIESEGVVLHDVDDAHAAGFTGAGVTVGAMSDGVSNLAASQAAGELPATVVVTDAGSGDEGTAMLEIVHDMAPGAALRFDARDGGVTGHVNSMNSLATGGADSITEDIPLDSEPAFQKGAAAANGDSITLQGISVSSSAGNLGGAHAARVQATGTGNGPEGTTVADAGCGLTTLPDNVVDIDPGAGTSFDLATGANAATLSATLQWSEPRAIFPSAGQGGFTDLNLFVMDATSTTCLAQSTGVQISGTGDTIEQVSGVNVPANTTVRLVVDVQDSTTATAAPLLDLRWRGVGAVDTTTQAGSLNPDDNYTDGATSVGQAITAAGGGTNDPTTAPLAGSSAGGPIQLVSTTICPNSTAGPCVGTAGAAGRTLVAPSWTAAGGVSVSGAGGFGSGQCPGAQNGDCLFFGTSAATPHAGAIDALLRQAVGGTPSVASLNQRLAETATDRGTAGTDNTWGAGVLDAHAAVTNEADLRLNKDCQPDTSVPAGDEFTCTVTIENLGPSIARNLSLTDVHVSDGSFRFNGTTPGAPTCTTTPNPQNGAGTVTCGLGDLAEGATTTVTITGEADEGQTIDDTATVGSDTPDPNAANNQAGDRVVVAASSDVEVVGISDSPDPVLAGEDLTYTVDIRNNGPSTATGTLVEDFLPAGVTVQSVSAPNGACQAGVPGDAARPTTCNFGTVVPGGQRTMTIVVTVGAASGSLQNDATVSSTSADPDTSNNSDSETTTVDAAADLSITKADSPDPVLAGKPLAYKLTVVNNGPSTAEGVVVTDVLPDEVDFVQATISNGSGTCTPTPTGPDSTTVECQLGTLAPNVNQPVVITIDTVVESETAPDTVIDNTATVDSSTADPDPGNNSDTEPTTISPRHDLAITQTSDGDVYKPSSTVMYTITVTNNGPSDATGVVVTDALPNVKQAVYVFDSAGCTMTGNTLTCNIGDITAGTSKSFNVYVRVKGSKGQIVNTVSVPTTNDPVTGNNTHSRTVLIKGGV